MINFQNAEIAIKTEPFNAIPLQWNTLICWNSLRISDVKIAKMSVNMDEKCIDAENDSLPGEVISVVSDKRCDQKAGADESGTSGWQ